jgi:DNA polymerase I-like protein with 3'-5' exonuclease and polymerase domains
MKIVVDIENTVTERNGKLHLDPFEPTNTLVMVGILTDTGEEYQITFDHADKEATENGHKIVQDLLDKAGAVICHNSAYDLMWLWESGFKYDGAVFDTMLAEYVLQRGIKQPLSLEACAERYEVDTKKQDTLKYYFKKGVTTREIPHDELVSYLSADLHATQQVANKLMYRLNSSDASLMDTVLLTNQLAVGLAKIYCRGFKVDSTALEDVRFEYESERGLLIESLEAQVREVMGDTPVNLNSPEQLSWVIYGRKVKDKTDWVTAIDPYMTGSDFKEAMAQHTTRLYRTESTQCTTCNGYGRIRKTKKDGTPFAKETRCIDCDGKGYIYTDTDKRAGFCFVPPSPKWASANGFTTNKMNLQMLENTAKNKGMKEAERFLRNVRRLSAVETYLSSFIDGIATHVKSDDRLHVRLLQHRTSTGRLSGADPNMQNMPRGGTDKVAIEEVKTGFDVHAYTAKIISDAGQPTSRQEAKAHTFAPLYGASGFGRTKAEASYYEHFTQKYKGIAEWHKTLAREALDNQKIATPSGREFAFPDVQRNRSGRISHFTQIKNYPVQSFATADIVPLALLHIDNLLGRMKSCIVNTVHDSIVIDVHPEEKNAVIGVIDKTNKELSSLISSRWGISFNVPLLLEAKIGYNWLDTKDVI